MPNKAQDDDLVMSLVELALARPPEEREPYLRTACAHDSELLDEVRKYVAWEERMNGFLLEPLHPPPPAELTCRPGDLLDGRFRIMREIAQGGMGIVYEARDEKLERRIAIKCAKAGFHKRLPPEARHATEISHPNVCKIFEIHTAATDHGEVDFLTMEFLDGETLAQRLRRGPLPDPEARTIARQLCAGLAAAHRNGVIHGDLKSGNVILATASDGSTRAVITDFGLARQPDATGQTARSGAAGGTPDYMAPELWQGQKATVRSDIYALGVILCELASGHTPFHGSPAMSWEERLNPRPPAVNPKWDRVLARCLQADPARRFASAEEVERALAPHSRRWIAAVAAAAAVAAISAVVTYERATTPPETARLALLPFESAHDLGPLADNLIGETAHRLAQVKGSAHTKFVFVPWDQVQRHKTATPADARAQLAATLALGGTVAREGDKLAFHVRLTDTKSLSDRRTWDAVYATAELRFAPTALAGLVTETLHLPPPNAAAVNATARDDYQKGLASMRHVGAGVDQAVARFERAVAADPDSPLTHAALAQAQWLEYRAKSDPLWLSRTTESVRQAQLRNPDLAPVHRMTARLFSNAGRYDQAAEEYLRATELEPENSEAYRLLGTVYENNNQLDKALIMLRRAVEVEPHNFANHQELGAFYYDRTNYTAAAEEFHKAVDLAPDQPNAHFALADAYINLGQFAEAERELRLALGLGETGKALEALGETLLYLRREREAIPYLLRAAELAPLSYVPWYYLGVAYRWLGQAAKSDQANRHGLDLIEKAVTENPRDGLVRSQLAYFCARTGDRRRAAFEAAQAWQQFPNDSDARWFVALTEEVLGQRNTTLAVLRDAPPQLLADLNRWPDSADLRKDPHFLQLLDSHQVK